MHEYVLKLILNVNHRSLINNIQKTDKLCLLTSFAALNVTKALNDFCCRLALFNFWFYSYINRLNLIYILRLYVKVEITYKVIRNY